MKIFRTSRTLAVARIGLMLTVWIGVSCAAAEQAREPTLVSARGPVATSNATSTDLQQCAGDAYKSALTAPDGHEFRLVYVAGYGCKYVIDGPSAVRVAGPNGYAFAWTHESGWRILSTID